MAHGQDGPAQPLGPEGDRAQTRPRGVGGWVGWVGGVGGGAVCVGQQGNMKAHKGQVLTNWMLNAAEMNLRAFTLKENPIPADKNQTLTQIEPYMPKQGGGDAL